MAISTRDMVLRKKLRIPHLDLQSVEGDRFWACGGLYETSEPTPNDTLSPRPHHQPYEIVPLPDDQQSFFFQTTTSIKMKGDQLEYLKRVLAQRYFWSKPLCGYNQLYLSNFPNTSIYPVIQWQISYFTTWS